MQKVISLLLMGCLIILLSACSRPVPSPGSVIVAPSFLKGQTAASGDLLGRTLYLNINKADVSYQQLVGKRYFVKFLLDHRYRLYRYGRVNELVSVGSYLYSVDVYHVEQAKLTMLGKKGLNMILLFNQSNESGAFYAHSNNASVKGQLSGSFVLNLPDISN